MDYANKEWLRPEKSLLKRLVQLVLDTFLVAIFLFAFAWAISKAEARVTMTLLEPSSNPATMGECFRTTGTRPRHVISKQDRTGENWHHRICIQ